MIYKFEHSVNNKKIIRKLEHRSITADRIRYYISIFTISLSICLILIFCMVASGERRIEMATQEGKAQFTAMMISENQYNTIKEQPEVEWVGIRTPINRSRQDNIDIMVYYKDEVEIENEERETKLIGKLPNENDEVVIQTEMLEALGKSDLDVGDNILLNISGTEEYYRISGILENNRTGDGSILVVPSLYPVLVSKEYGEELYGAELDYYCDVRLNTDSVSQTLITEMASDVLAKADLEANHILLISNYFSVLGSLSDANDTTWVYAIAIAVFFAILSGGVVYSVFYISVSGKVRLYGQLRTIGMTKKQVRKTVRRESIFLAIRGIPLGWILGVGIGYLLNPKGFRISDTLLWIIISTIFTLISISVSARKPAKIASKTSPIEGVRYSPYSNETYKSTSKKKKIKHLDPIYLGYLNLGRHRRKNILTAFMMSLSAILLLTVGTVSVSLSAYNNAVFWQFPNGQFQLTIASDNFGAIGSDISEQDADLQRLGDSIIQANNNPLNEELISLIESIDGVEEITTTTGFSAFTTLSESTNSSTVSGSVNYTLTENQFEMIKPALIGDGDIEWEEFSDNNGVLVANALQDNLLNPISYSIGDKVDTAMLSKDGSVVHVEREVMGFFSTDKLMELKVTPGSPQFLMSREAALKINGMTNDIVNIQIKVESSKQEDVRAVLEELTANNGNLSLKILDDNVDQKQEDYDSIAQLLTILSIIVFVFSVINFVNSSVTNLKAREHEIGLLQAVGMTKKQLKVMLETENMFYVIWTIISSIIGTGIGILVCHQLDKSFHCIAYEYPVKMLMIFICSLLLCYLLLMIYISKDLKDKELLERINVNE